MTTSNLSAEFGFTDGTSKTVSFSPFNPNSNAVTNFKANVMAFNDSVSSGFQSAFLSNDGASATKIIAATVTTTSKEILFAKSAEYAYKVLTEGSDDIGNG